MNFPKFSAKGMVGIRYFSSMNNWIDFVVFVPEDRVLFCAGKILHAMDEFWEYEYETYGDALYAALSDETYFIIFHDDEDESDEYEEKWEKLMESDSIIDLYWASCF